MTSPPIYNWGPSSDQFFNELAQFNAQRDSFYQNFFNKTNLVGQATGLTQPTGQIPFTGQTATQQGAAQMPPLEQWQDADLLGAAKFWGIPEEIARQMPKDVLIQQLNKFRSEARPADDTAMQRLGDAGIMLASMPAMAALGVGEAITGGLGNLPFVGGALKKLKPIHEADMWLRSLEEGVRASNPEDFKYALNTAEFAGNVAAMWYPAAGAYALSGKVLGGIFKGAPILRASLQGLEAAKDAGWATRATAGAMKGLVSAGMLEGGSEHPYAAMAFGTGLGGAGEAAAPWLAAAASRIAKKFVTPAMLGPDLPYGPLVPETLVPAGEDIGQVAAAAMQGDESAIALMQELQRTGKIPQASVQSWHDRAAETMGPIAEQSQRMRRQFFPSGYPFQGMNAETAETAALQMNKAGTIIESPALPQSVKVTLPDEITVGFAAQSSNPGGVNIVEGINNPADFSALGQNVAFAQRNGRLSALVSDQPISPDMVSEFERYGMFSGQRVQGPAGKEVEIVRIIGNRAHVKELTSSQPELTNALELYHGSGQSFDKFKTPAFFTDDVSTAQQYANMHENPVLYTVNYIGKNPVPQKLLRQLEQEFGGYRGQFAEDPEFMQQVVPRLRELGYDSVALPHLYNKGKWDYVALTPEIVSIKSVNGHALVKDPYGFLTQTVRLEQLSPLTQSPGIHEVPELWSEFYNYADQMATQTQVAMGGALSPAQINTVKSNSLQQWMDDFLDGIGVQSLGDRARIKNYFNQRWTEGFYNLAPEQTAQNLAGQAELAETLASHTPTPLGRVDDLAATKGFTVVPNGQGGYLLVDAGLGNQPQFGAMQFSDLEAAETFLKKVNRELPDISPNSDVPGEIAGVLTREPPPEINTNAKFPAQINKSLNKMSNNGVPPINPAEAAEAEGNFGKMNSNWKDGFMRWEPARRVFSKISQQVRNVAGDDFGIARVYDEGGVMLNRHHTAMAPKQNELAEVFKGVTTVKMLNGEFIDVWSIPDPALRAKTAQGLGWDNKDVAALANFDQLLAKIHGNAEAGNELRSLVTHIRQQKSLGQDPWKGFQPGATAADFYEVSKGADFGLREMDPRRLGDSYIRSVFWQRDMAEWFAGAKQQAKVLKQTEGFQDVGHFLDNWLDIVKQGYRPEDDIALDGIHALGRAVLGKSFSRQQARELVSLGLNTTHASMLGYRVHVMARDALQLFFAIPRAGPELAEVITKFTSNAKFRQEVWDEVFAEGAASAMMPNRTAPGALTGELEAAGAGIAPEGMSKRMQAAGWITSTLRDIMPDFVKGSSESVLKPLYFYGKQGQMMRALVYKSGQIKAERALEGFRKTFDMDALMAESGARTFDPAWQEEFKRIVATGDDHKAASFLGRQLADATQFKYGVAENPAVARTVTGRMFMQMGSFQSQYLQYIRESLSNGGITDKAKFLLTAGTVSAGLEAASRETGWNFRWMNPYMIGFFGGPWVSTGAAMLQAGSAAARTLQGDGTITPFNSNLMNAGVQAAGNAAMMLNPLNGLYRTATGVGSALNDSPTPGVALGRLAITGERGALPDILNSIGIEQMQPSSNPTRMEQMQLPYTPRMQPVYPQGMPQVPNGANLGSGYVQPPNVVPLPGGRAAGAGPNPAQQFMPNIPPDLPPELMDQLAGAYMPQYDPNNPGSGGMY